MADGRPHVVIVEDQTLMREGLRSLLSAQARLEVVGEGADGGEAVHLAEQLRPDLLLLSLALPGGDGSETMMAIRRVSPGTRILALAVDSAEEPICSALQAGVSGIVLKDSSGSELFMAIDSLLAGEKYLAPAIATTLVTHLLSIRKQPSVNVTLEHLSDREREILRLVAEGYRPRAIAELLGMAAKAVEKHRTNLMRKLGLPTVQALTALAIKKGLVAHGHRAQPGPSPMEPPDPISTLSG